MVVGPACLLPRPRESRLHKSADTQIPITFRGTLQRAQRTVGCAHRFYSPFFLEIYCKECAQAVVACGRGRFPCATSDYAMKPKRPILCVDDNEQSLSIRKVMLETRGYRVLACTNGQDALEAFKAGGIDLVLSDLVMPGLDGHKLIEEIKQLSPNTPAILFSGKIKIYERDMRADIFLPKGMYAPAELLERIRLLLIRKRGPKRVLPLSGLDPRSRASAG